MKLDRVFYAALNCPTSRCSCDAARNIRRICGKPCRCFFDDNQKSFHFFKPDCFRTLFSVPAAMSPDSLPEIVTNPLFVECYWRWLPFVRTKNHPSCSINFINSRTFTNKAYSARASCQSARLTLELSGTAVEPSEAPAKRRNEGVPLEAFIYLKL